MLADLHARIEQIKLKCESVKKTLQPFPAIVGLSSKDTGYDEEKEGVTQSYVVINAETYPVNSPLDAIDICFNAYHALHSHYPCQSSYSWLFLQQAVYNLKTRWDFSAPQVTTLVKAYQDIKV